MAHEDKKDDSLAAEAAPDSEGDARADAVSETGGSGDAPAGDTADAFGESNVIELRLRGGMRSRVGPAPNGAMCEFKSLDAATALDELNSVLWQYECHRAVPVFNLSEDKLAGLHALAAEQEVELPDLSGLYLLYFSEGVDLRGVAERLRGARCVERAAVVPRTIPASARPFELPADELLHPPRDGSSRDHQWYIFRCRIERAWRLGFTGKGVVIADIDWGFKTDHPDLAPRLDLAHAINSADPTCDPAVGHCNVSQGGRLTHGTAVLGLAGAAADQSGMVGVAHDAELWPIQVNVNPPAFPLDPLSWARAIQFVADADSGGRRKVLILEGQCLGGTNITQIDFIKTAVLYAITNRVVVCVPAGNGKVRVNLNADNQLFEPVGILVGATVEDDQPWSEPGRGTNFGPEIVTAAPGVPTRDLTCSVDSNLYTSDFGATSGATAKVAGAVALMLEANCALRHVDVERILKTTGTPVAGGQLGRLLDCEAAVLAARAFQRTDSGARPTGESPARADGETRGPVAPDPPPPPASGPETPAP